MRNGHGTTNLPAHEKVNLVLVTARNTSAPEDFERIAGYVREIDPAVRAIAVRDRSTLLQRWRLSLRPTMAFAPVRPRRFHLRRGAMFHGQMLTKSQEYVAMAKIGVPMARWALLTETHVPDLSDFTSYVVRKPDGGGLGAEVKILKKSRVKWKPWKTRVGVQGAAWIVQDFIYTGPWPVSHRVTTLFGEVVHSWRTEADHRRAALPSPDAFGAMDGQGVSIVASGRGCRVSLNFDQEIIDLGCRAAKAFPDIPLLGIDIVREASSGKLFVLEVNATGFVWHFSSREGLGIQRDNGIDLERQFDGIRKAARVLAEAARRRAR